MMLFGLQALIIIGISAVIAYAIALGINEYVRHSRRRELIKILDEMIKSK